jgi:hypothetical protein
MNLRSSILTLILLAIPSVSFADKIAVFHSKGAKCQIIKPSLKELDCSKKKNLLP